VIFENACGKECATGKYTNYEWNSST